MIFAASPAVNALKRWTAAGSRFGSRRRREVKELNPFWAWWCWSLGVAGVGVEGDEKMVRD
jgi:hypothetical protein